MRKIQTFMTIFAGTIFLVFMFNILLYVFVPEFRNTVLSLVADRDIPVVTVTEEPEVQEDINLDKAVEKKPYSYYKITYINNDPVALEDQPAEEKPAIIDREYHEDCGTGKGYWVITYEDGTTEIE